MQPQEAVATSRFWPGTSDDRAMAIFHALGQQTRLSIYRLLVEHRSVGLAVGALAQSMNCPQNTMSNHLAVLARAQLISRSRQGRSVVYRASSEALHELIEDLLSLAPVPHQGVSLFNPQEI